MSLRIAPYHDSNIANVSSGFRGKIGSNIIHLPETDSTMDDARSIMRTAPSDESVRGTVVIADAQRSGRGRFGRKWVSGKGEDILMSILLTPRPTLLGQLTMMGALACSMTVDVSAVTSSKIKWPNDVLVDGMKISGVIAEAATVRERQVAVLGIGLNVNLASARSAATGINATSIRSLRGQKHRVQRASVLSLLLTHLNELYDALKKGESIFPEWKSRLKTLGEEVNIAMPSASQGTEYLSGVAEDVDEFGRLLVKDANGRIHAVSAGEVSIGSG